MQDAAYLLRRTSFHTLRCIRARRRGLEDEVPRTGEQDLLAHLHANLARKYVGVLVLALMGVHGRSEGPCSDRVLDEREVPPALLRS
jgi:hypothetical protein